MIGSLMICVSAVVLLVGMVAGIAMGIKQDFLLSPAHAHLNLVGFVLPFVAGLYYRVVPAAAASRLAAFQAPAALVGGIVRSDRFKVRGCSVHFAMLS